VAEYKVNKKGVAFARRLIREGKVVPESDWTAAQPSAADENGYLKSHSWDEYGQWHLGLTEGPSDETKARYAFVFGDFKKLHRMGVISGHYRAAEHRHKEIELAAHDLLQYLDRKVGARKAG
jgi:hypothetical protein